MTTNINTTTAQGATADAPQEWSLIQVVKFCNEANLSNIKLQSASVKLMNDKMNDQDNVQRDCTVRADSASNHSNAMYWTNVAMTVFSIATIPLAIGLSCVAGPEVIGGDLALQGAIQSASTCVDIGTGASSATLGTTLAVTQVKYGQDQSGIQTDSGAIQNIGSQTKELGDTLTSVMKTAQGQGQIVGALINNTTHADTAYKHKET